MASAKGTNAAFLMDSKWLESTRLGRRGTNRAGRFGRGVPHRQPERLELPAAHPSPCLGSQAGTAHVLAAQRLRRQVSQPWRRDQAPSNRPHNGRSHLGLSVPERAFLPRRASATAETFGAGLCRQVDRAPPRAGRLGVPHDDSARGGRGDGRFTPRFPSGRRSGHFSARPE